MLQGKKLIKGKKFKNGNLPDRTVYSITQKGKELLNKNLVSYLSTPEDTLTELPLSLFLMGSLEKTEVLSALQEYRKKQADEIRERTSMVESEKKRGVPYSGLLAIEHILNILKVNLDTVNEVIRQVEADSQWSHHPLPFWRSEFSQQDKPARK